MRSGADFRAILFDFDGTLADSYEAIAASVNHVRAEYGLAPLTTEEVKGYVGHGPAHLLGHTVGPEDMERAVASYRAHHPSVMIAHTHLLPGALETLQRIVDSGRPMALCSNKPRFFTQRLLEHLDIARFFAAVLGPEDVAEPKPAPDMLLAGLGRLGLKAAEALYVGDMVVDIRTARAAGTSVWVVPTGSDVRGDLEAAGPDRLFDDLFALAANLG